MLKTAEDFGVWTQVEAGKVEEREGVSVAEIEEEVGGTLVVAILEHVGEWELEQVLVEAHGLLNVGAEQRHVVDATRRRRWRHVPHVGGLDSVAASVEGSEIERTVSHAKIVHVQAFTYDALPGRVVFGLGARVHVAGEVAGLGATSVFLIASGSASSVADEIADALGDWCAARWSEVAEHVPVELAERARVRSAREAQADAIVCVGGGSAIGLAKAVALELNLPILAMPTTYTGSEMTPMYGLTGEHKHTGRDPRVLPRVVVYDPELTRTLPVVTSAGSALNALAHCVEGLYGPGANPVTSLAAVEGIRVLAEAIAQIAADPEDLGMRSELLYGAYLAGTVIATVGVGIHHRTCHVLGGSYGLSHAACNAVVLPHTIAYERAGDSHDHPSGRRHDGHE